MKKFAALLLAVVLTLSMSFALAETKAYFGNFVYCEAGYENDVYNGVANVLFLNDDGTFILMDNTSIIHNSYKVVTSWAYEVRGTYEVVEQEDTWRLLSLKAESIVYIMNGAVTTSEEDPDLFEDFEGLQVEVDDANYSVKNLLSWW